jgi:hypothetical protein
MLVIVCNELLGCAVCCWCVSPDQVREIMAGLGFRTLDDMVGRADMLEQDCEPGSSKVGCCFSGPSHIIYVFGHTRQPKCTYTC